MRRTDELKLSSAFFENVDICTCTCRRARSPKDGPSAGIALVSAVVSLLTGRKVRSDVAMTGEVTLRGAVLPVGGIKAKVLAAHRAGLKTVILPERNKKDLVEVPEGTQRALVRVRQPHPRGPDVVLEPIASARAATANPSEPVVPPRC